MVSKRLILQVCALAMASFGTATAASIVNLTVQDTRTLSIVGANAVFHFHTGPGKGGKALASQEHIIDGSAQGSTTASYTSAASSYNFSSGIAAGSTVSAATLDFATLVQQVLALSAPVLDTANSSSPECPSGLVITGSGNCRADPLTVGLGASNFYLETIQIGSATYTWAGNGTSIASLGTVNLATLNVNFLSQLGGGNQITLTWAQAATLTGYLGSAPGEVINDNMLCKNCAVYYNDTSSASQNTRLTALFNATFNPIFPSPPRSPSLQPTP